MRTVELHHEAVGEERSPPLLLGGSLGTTLAMWEPQVPTLAARARAIRFDHRGHGASPVPSGPYAIADLGNDVIALLDRLAIARASYCGLSIGGMVGLWLATHAPERIDRLVLICTSAHPASAADYAERAASVREAGTPEAIADTVVARWFTPGFAREHPDVVAHHRAMIAATPAEGYAGCCEAIADLDLRSVLADIRARTLVIAGAEDSALPPAHGRAIADAITGARLEVLDHAAHLASVEQAAAVTMLIADHLDSREAA
ncbi:MAG TPA: 3-oxoadipate enol-lactonase [Solirubrobacteraceae bacterium]